MKSTKTNAAFIDSQNLNLGVKDLGWSLDFVKFRKYLEERFDVGPDRAFLFIGYVPGYERLYEFLQEAGYTRIFKPTMTMSDGTIKGNVDAELVLHTMIEYPNFDQAVIVTGDGDFRCLVEYLMKNDKLKTVIVPNRRKLSWLLKSLCKSGQNIFHFVENFSKQLGKS
jgi:uncharacterized LabA/DUF88 family protein